MENAELEKKKIHMDRICAKVQSQITLEDDINLPESKQDVHSVKMYKGNVNIDEIKPGTDVVYVKGWLCVNLLYYTTEEKKGLVSLEGKVPFEEKIHMEKVTAQSDVDFNIIPEDLSVSMIHSRKLRIQAVLDLKGVCKEVYEESLPVAVSAQKGLEARKKTGEYCALINEKKEEISIKEEIALPAGYPNIYRILWWDVHCVDFQWRAGEDSVKLTGEMSVFILYETEEENAAIRTFETRFACKQSFDMPDCREEDCVNAILGCPRSTLQIHPDADGEERIFALQWSLGVKICACREGKEEVLSDAYSTTGNLKLQYATADIKRLLCNMTGKTKASMRYHIEPDLLEDNDPEEVLELFLYHGQVLSTEIVVKEQEVCLEGAIAVKAMFATRNDENPYKVCSFMMPYEAHLEIPMVKKDLLEVSEVTLEELQLTLSEKREVEAKAVLSFHVMAFDGEKMQIIEGMRQEPLDRGNRYQLPGMAIHLVRPGEALWEIGKKYYVSVEEIQKLNELTGEEVSAGQKLMILRDFGSDF